MIDGNQYLNVTAYANNPLSPFVYNIIISNSVTNTVLTSNLVSTSSNTASFVWQVPNADAGNTLEVNVIVENSASAYANSIYTYVITLSPQFQSTGWTASNSVLDVGQSETLTANIARGTNSITYASFNQLASSYIQTPLELNPPFTLTMWLNQLNYNGAPNGFAAEQNSWRIRSYSGTTQVEIFNSIGSGTTFGTPSPIPLNTWTLYAFSYSSANVVSQYFNGNLVEQGTYAYSPMNPVLFQMVLGAAQFNGYFWNGTIADAQIYNTTLSPAQVNAIYAEGITGAPIAFNSLVGWWLLNGNAGFSGANVIDYSHNQNYGTPTAVTYVTSYNAFTYNILVYNSIGKLVANSLTGSNQGIIGTPATSNTFTFSTTGFTAGTYTANLIATDSATTFNTVVNSITFTVSNTPSATTPTFSNTPFDIGQTTTLSIMISNGIGPFVANFIYANGIVANTVSGISKGQTANFVFNPATANTYTFNVVATDTGSLPTPYIFNTIDVSVTAYNTLKVTQGVSNVMIDGNQYLNITAYATGGVQPYTYNFIISNSVTNTIITNTQYNSVVYFNKHLNLASPQRRRRKHNRRERDSYRCSIGNRKLRHHSCFYLSPQFQSTGWTASNSVLKAGQTEVLTANILGGTNSITMGQFNGANSYIPIPTNAQVTGTTFTWSMWANSLVLGGQLIAQRGVGLHGLVLSPDFLAGPPRPAFSTYNGATYSYSNIQAVANQWFYYTAVYNGVNLLLYVDGVAGIASAPFTETETTGTAYVGVNYDGVDYPFNGQITNVQIYNTALSGAQVAQLYSEGITGAPIATNSLLAWWTLNGNANFNGANVIDYSHNQNYGTPNNVLYPTTSNAFTYNMLVYNGIGSLVASSLLGTDNGMATSATSNTFTFSTTGFTAGTYTANLIATDSATSYNTVTNSITFTVSNTPSATTPTFSNTPFDIGQTTTLSTMITNGIGTFVANFIYANGIVANTVSGISKGQTANFVFNPATANTYTFNVVATDTGSLPTPYVFNTIDVSVTVSNTPSATTPTFSNTPFDIGQTTTLSTMITNGIGTFVANFIYANGIVANTVSGISKGQTANFVFNPATANTYTFNVVATDTGSLPTPYVFNTIDVSVTVSNTPSATTPTFSNTPFDIGQTTTLSTMITNGIGTFVANFIYANGIVANTVSGISKGQTANFVFNPATANTYTFNVVATDTGSLPTPYVFNTIDVSVTVSNTPSATTPTFSNTPFDIGQTTTLSTMITNGIGTFVANFIYANGIVANTVSGISKGQTANFVFNPATANTYTFNVVATDTGSLPTPYVFNTIDVSVTVSNTPSATTPTFSNTPFDIGQTTTLSTMITNGIGTFVANFIYANGIVANTVSGISKGQTANFVFNPATANTYTFNVVATDTGSLPTPYVFNTIDVSVTVSNTPSATTPTFSNTPFDIGQTTTLSTMITNGIGTFVANFIYANGIVANTVSGISKGQTANFVFNPATANTYTFNVVATDTGSLPTPYVFNTIDVSVTVSNTPSATTPTFSNTPFDIGQTNLSTMITNGIGTFVANFIYANGIVANTVSGISKDRRRTSSSSQQPQTHTRSTWSRQTGSLPTPYVFNTIDVSVKPIVCQHTIPNFYSTPSQYN